MAQAPQAGLREWHTRRPWKTTRCESIVQSLLGKIAATSASTFSASSAVVQPKRRARRPKCVSTVIPGTPKALPSTTLAVLRPTPGSVTRSSRRPGTLPSKRSRSAADSPSSDFVLARKKPVGRISSSSSSGGIAAMSSGVGQTANRRGVVWLTRRSVVWADSTVATSSSKGLVKSSSGWAYGYSSASSRLILRARRTMAVRDSGLRAGAVLAGADVLAADVLAADVLAGAVFFATAFFATAFLAAGALAVAVVFAGGVSFTAAFFPAEVLPTGVVSLAVGRDAPEPWVPAFRLDVTLERDLLLLSVFDALMDGCSPTAESPTALTHSAPQSRALTGVLDTRPD